jgi:DNA-binding HxlR family transcriptional regulator
MTKNKFSVYAEKCPSRNVLEGISDKWSILILGILSANVYRFGELKRQIGGISPKMLTQTLQKLEKYGFIARTPFEVLPLKVEYALTPLGKELSLILHSLTTWTENNMHQIASAESNYLKSS